MVTCFHCPVRNDYRVTGSMTMQHRGRLQALGDGELGCTGEIAGKDKYTGQTLVQW